MQEMNIRFVAERILRGWMTLAALAALFMLLVLAGLPFQRPAYNVIMTVVPAPNDQSEPQNTAGAFTSLLGLGGAQGNSNYLRYQKLLISPIVAQRMDQKYGMVRYVYSQSWDKENNRWRVPQTFRSVFLGWIFALSHVPVWSPPDAVALSDYMTGNLQIVPSTQNDIVTISMKSGDVAFARRVMLAAHTEANAVLRDQVARRGRQQVAYLQGKLAQTTVSDYRATLLQILSAQEKTVMLTQTDAFFAAEILSPPTASATPVSPRPLLSMFVACLVGILVGMALVIFLGPDWWQKLIQKILLAGRGAYSASRAP
jgi:hypothetical protein